MYNATRHIFFLATILLISPILTSPVDSDSSESSYLFVRAPPEQEEVRGQGGAADSGQYRDSGTAEAHRPSANQLANPSESIERPSYFLELVPPEQADGIARLQEEVRAGSTEIWLYRIDPKGVLLDEGPTNVAAQISELREVYAPKGGIIYEFATPKPYQVRIPGGTKTEVSWDVTYYSKAEITEAQRAYFDTRMAQRNQPQWFGNQWNNLKRSTPINAITTDEATKNSTQDQAGEFQVYLDALYLVEAQMYGLVAPVLNNLTSQTNSTAVHSMAESILYDITGSTTVLEGPFRYGFSFLGNLTNTTASASSVDGDNTTSSNATGITAVYQALQDIYSGMWVEAVNAANSTGLLPRHAFLLECLQTNDTSLYPPGYNTVPAKPGSQAGH